MNEEASVELSPRAVLSLAHDDLGATLELLSRLVAINSHADNGDGVAACLALLQPPLERLGFVVRQVEAEAPHPDRPGATLRRRHLVADRDGDAAAPRLMLLGHVDTVFPASHPFQSLVRDGAEWRGPGVADMKGGIVTALLALGLAGRFALLDRARWRMVLVSDEEQGSPTGARVLDEAAAGVDLALSFEAARSCGGLVVARKGYGGARVTVHGRSGHAGIAHDSGVNALTALARFIVAAEALEGAAGELTISPGGRVEVTPPQLSAIPDFARCELEWRFFDLPAGEWVLAQLFELGRTIGEETGARIEVDARIEAVPLPRTPASARLLDVYVRAAADVGLEVRGVATAGVGDINAVARFGAVCLDGVGPEGDHFHTAQECLRVDSIARRAAMNVLALQRYLTQPNA